MKYLSVATGLLMLGFIAATPAHADFAVVQYGNGHCQIWWDSGDNPWATPGKRSLSACPTGQQPRSRSIAPEHKISAPSAILMKQ